MSDAGFYGTQPLAVRLVHRIRRCAGNNEFRRNARRAAFDFSADRAAALRSSIHVIGWKRLVATAAEPALTQDGAISHPLGRAWP
ncbi:hypothetical protein BA177_01620 [Woeseia oceani]|uniref:Uncharacterized protein n=1 Tax=Woeseia oceani TaxID=1548547 RepID=A0A193LC93_9GAMM|nr:hypothetical protein BA177_01620 [Woeseia oceani]